MVRCYGAQYCVSGVILEESNWRIEMYDLSIFSQETGREVWWRWMILCGKLIDSSIQGLVVLNNGGFEDDGSWQQYGSV